MLGLDALPSYYWFIHKSSRPRATQPPPVTTMLANRNDIIGEWRRVEAPEAGMDGHWRIFTSNGEFRVCYGCYIVWGTYTFENDRTLVTRDGHDGRLSRWQIGRADGKLVLVHLHYGWVEEFVSVLPGTLER
jgi:hypothetical protein